MARSPAATSALTCGQGRSKGRRLDGRSPLRAPRRLPAAARTGLAAALHSRAHGCPPRPSRRPHVEGGGMSAVATAAPAFGHNELSVRLGILANDAQLALDRVAKGEGDAIEGWLDYGAALNEGRA